MRIGILTASVSRAGGGIFSAVQGLAGALSRQGADCRVFGLEDAFTAEDRSSWGSIEMHAARTIGPRTFGYAPGLLTAMIEANLDVLHVLSTWMYPSVAALAWRQRTARPVIVSGNGSFDAWALENSAWKKRIAGALYERPHLNRAACVQALSKAELHHLRNYGLKNPICVVPNGANLDINNAAPAPPSWSTQRVPDGAHILLYLGRLHPKKNILALIKAWARVQHGARARNDWWLVIAGWNQLGHEAILKQAVASLAAPRVVFIGPQFGADKAACLARASAFVLPSLSEGLPMAVLEAWAARLPVLMTPECNIPAGVMNGAAIECEGSVEGIAAGLARLLSASDEELQRMGEAGRALVAARFTWDQVAADMIAVYRWVLGDSERPAFVEI